MDYGSVEKRKKKVFSIRIKLMSRSLLIAKVSGVQTQQSLVLLGQGRITYYMRWIFVLHCLDILIPNGLVLPS